MARSRLLLQEELEQALGSDQVYYQPPPNVQMTYPCIVYNLDFASTQFADNQSYRHHWRYEVTVIDRDPDSLIPENVRRLPMCVFTRAFAKDDLNHHVFDLYF